MNKVITINLNGRAYQLEEAGFDSLQKYLDQASVKLNDNPDKEELMADFEQAIADKCDKFLNNHKTVISVKEINEIIKQMGPVHTAEEKDEKKSSHKKEEGAKTDAPKKLFQIREGAIISGVCNGLAAYFNVDVNWVRLAFVAMLFITKGAWIMVYLVMMVIVPFANTSEEQAEAHGEPFNAKELLERAKKKYSHLDKKYFHKQGKYWEKWAKDKGDQFSEGMRHASFQMGGAGETFLKVMKGLSVAFLSLVWVWAVISIVTTGALFGTAFGAIPLWVMVLIVTCLFSILILPLRHMNSPKQTYDYGQYGTLDAILWLMILVIAGWAAWTYIPGVHVVTSSFEESVKALMQK